MHPFERLIAWQHAHRLVLETYRLTSAFPANERFGLTAQARRAAFSVAANIAEGCAKRGKPEFRRYLDIVLGSMSELTYAMMLARDLRYLSVEDWQAFEVVRAEAGRTIWGLYVAVSGKQHRP